MRWKTNRPFAEWILAFAKLYFLPMGRIGRADYLIAFLTILFIAIIGLYLPSTAIEVKKVGAQVIGTKLVGPHVVGFSAPPGKEYLSQIMNIAAILCIWILLASTLKRLRDLGSKLWYAVFVFLAPINILVILGLLLSEGNPGTNQYGPPKKTLSL